jgi:hypothetical protein
VSSTDPVVAPAVTPVQRVALVLTMILAGVLGTWAYLWPRLFFDRFPVVLGTWISTDGPYNEHFVRDHGAMYLALGAAGVFALARPSAALLRGLGIVWTVFAVLHGAYHLAHLYHLTRREATGLTVALATAVLLGVALLLPGPGRLAAHPARARR